MRIHFRFFPGALLLLAPLSATALEAWEANAHRTISRCDAALRKFGSDVFMNTYGGLSIHGVAYSHTNRSLSKLRAECYSGGELAPERVKGKKIIDVPAGKGATTIALHEEGAIATGVDILVDPATNPPEYLHQAKWDALPAADGSQDIVMLNNGILLYSHEYTDVELVAALREAIRVKSPKGELLITGVAEPARFERLATQLGLIQTNKYPSTDKTINEKSRWTYSYRSTLP